MQLKEAINTIAARTLCVPHIRVSSSSKLAASQGSSSGAWRPEWAAALKRYGRTTQWSTWKSAPKLAAHHFKAACIDADAVGPPRATNFRNCPNCNGVGAFASTSFSVQNFTHLLKDEIRAPKRCTDSLAAPTIVASRTPLHWRGSSSWAVVTPKLCKSKTYLTANSNITSSLACLANSSLLNGSGPAGPLSTAKPPAPPTGCIALMRLDTGGGLRVTTRELEEDAPVGTLDSRSWTTVLTWASRRTLASRQAAIQNPRTWAAKPSEKDVHITVSSSSMHAWPDFHRPATSAQDWTPRSQIWLTTSLGRATSRSRRLGSSSSDLSIRGDRDFWEGYPDRRCDGNELSRGIVVAWDLHHVVHRLSTVRIGPPLFQTAQADQFVLITLRAQGLRLWMLAGLTPTVSIRPTPATRLGPQGNALLVPPLVAEDESRPGWAINQTCWSWKAPGSHATVWSSKKDTGLLLHPLPVDSS